MLEPTSAQRMFVERHLSRGEQSFTALIRDLETFKLVAASFQTCGHAYLQTLEGPVLRVFLDVKKRGVEGWFELDSCGVWRLWRQNGRNVMNQGYQATTLAMFPGSGFDYIGHLFRAVGPCMHQFEELAYWSFEQDKGSSVRVAEHLLGCAPCRSIIRRLSDHPDAFTRPLAVLADVMAQLRS